MEILCIIHVEVPFMNELDDLKVAEHVRLGFFFNF